MNLLPKGLIAAQYKEAFTAYLKANAETRVHNEQILDTYIASVKPVQCKKLLLSTGVTVVTTGREDGYWLVAEHDKLERWEYFNTAGESDWYEVKPEDEKEPFFGQYLSLSEYGVGETVYLLAGTDVKALEQDFKDHMTRLPEEPAHGTLDWQQVDRIQAEVRRELGQEYEEEVPF